MESSGDKPFRVLFICTHNSARSQIAEALLRSRGGLRFVAASAGSDPADEVHPLARQVIASLSGNASAHRPKSCDEAARSEWDLVITVCDRARESCPRFPGRPATVHWGLPDPTAITGPEDAQRQAFRETATVLARRIDLLLALPVEKLERLAVQQQLSALVDEGDASD